MININTILGIANSLENANMQAHMRGYATDNNFSNYSVEEEIRRALLEKDFNAFIGSVIFHLYWGKRFEKESHYPHKTLIDHILGRINAAEKNEKAIEYLVMINEDLLNDPNFQNNPIKFLGAYTEKGEMFMPGMFDGVEFTVSYIAGTTNEQPNIIRVGITEATQNNTSFLNGNIDFCSNGDVIIHDFEKKIQKTRLVDSEKNLPVVDEKGNIVYDIEISPATLNDSWLEMSDVNEMKDLFMHLFELADLRTGNQSR